MEVASEERENENFYSTLRILFLFTKCSGLLSLNGLRQKTSNGLGFSWLSINFLFINAPCILVHYIVLVAFFYSCVTGDALSRYPEMALWLCGETCSVLLVRFSRNFKSMILDIEKIEASIPPVANNETIRKKITLIATYFAFAIMANYIFQEVIYTIVNEDCKKPDGNKKNPLKTYFETPHECFIKFLPTNLTMQIIFQIIKLQAFYLWTIMDALIISYCIYLENQFKHFNDILFKKTMKDAQERVNWNELRYHYTNLCDLVRAVDKYINPITFVTFFTNMLLICQHMFLIIGNQSGSFSYVHSDCHYEERNKNLQKIRTLIFTILLIIKTACVLFSSARLHSTSRKPLEALGTIPRNIYTYETQHFMDQVYHSTVALSSYELFYFTKETILTVCSVIVTYELMLIQM